jgi:hypothetical protein
MIAIAVPARFLRVRAVTDVDGAGSRGDDAHWTDRIR